MFEFSSKAPAVLFCCVSHSVFAKAEFVKVIATLIATLMLYLMALQSTSSLFPPPDLLLQTTRPSDFHLAVPQDSTVFSSLAAAIIPPFWSFQVQYFHTSCTRYIRKSRGGLLLSTGTREQPTKHILSAWHLISATGFGSCFNNLCFSAAFLKSCGSRMAQMSLRRAAQSIIGHVAHKLSVPPSSTLGESSQNFLRNLYSSTRLDSQSLIFTDSTLLRIGPQQRLFTSSITSLRNIDVQIQSMGESITEGTIAEIMKQVGDSVAEDETIAQIETDKVTIDIRAPAAGKVAELRVRHMQPSVFFRVLQSAERNLTSGLLMQMQADDTVKVGQLVAVIAVGEGKPEIVPYYPPVYF